MRAALLAEWPALAHVSGGALNPLTVGQFSRAEIDVYVQMVEEIDWRNRHG